MKARRPSLHVLTPHGATISGDSTACPPLSCACCKGELGPGKAGRKFCKPRCRLLYWAMGQIVKEYEVGNADGLKEFIERIRP